MQTIRAYFRERSAVIRPTWNSRQSLKRGANIAATKHSGPHRLPDENGERNFDNMLKETIFAATMQIRQSLGENDWCVSVFEDNAGIVEFDDEYNMAFKVETHNRPSALGPLGGANTGIGGVIRDTLGTGMGARPICNTDVFCFASPDTPPDELPPGVLHLAACSRESWLASATMAIAWVFRRSMERSILTSGYVGNPLVFCGNVGMIPVNRLKQPQTGDLIVSSAAKRAAMGFMERRSVRRN